MAKKTQEQLWDDWVAIENIVRFQELLKAETDRGEYSLLTQLLAHEFEKLKKSPGP